MGKLKKTEDESKSRAERIKQLEEELRQVRSNEIIVYIVMMYTNFLLIVQAMYSTYLLRMRTAYLMFVQCTV